jgi:phosphatidylglycerophosphate synthase
MDMHRVGKRADWQKVANRQRNPWQRLADKTSGVITIGNALTIIGFALVVAGLAALAREHYWLAVGLLFVGRSCDLLDGWAASMTGTKSPLGEKLDAGFDKLATVLTLTVLLLIGIVPWLAVALIAVPHIAIAAVSAMVLSRGKLLHPSRWGKNSMAAAWLSLGSFVLWTALDIDTQLWARCIAYSLVIISSGMSLLALSGYYRQLKRVL